MCRSVHGSKGNQFRCTVAGCSYTSKYKGHLGRHIKGTHMGLKPHRCDWWVHHAPRAPAPLRPPRPPRPRAPRAPALRVAPPAAACCSVALPSPHLLSLPLLCCACFSPLALRCPAHMLLHLLTPSAAGGCLSHHSVRFPSLFPYPLDVDAGMVATIPRRKDRTWPRTC